jgi:hypothetical protein
VFADLTRAFAGLFTERRSRLAVLALLVTMAAIPVAELGVIRTFSQLIIKGPQEFDTDRAGVVDDVVLFFAGFAVTRGLHHLSRFWRVRVFRRGFQSSGLQRTHGSASWEWAQAFELSVVSVGLIQVATFSGLFFLLNPLVGAVNVLVCAAAVAAVAGMYRHQLRRQFAFAEEGMRPGSTSVSERIATRVFAAEFGSIIATVSMALMMLVVLWRTLAKDLSGADGVVLFLGLRLLYGHLGALAPSVMRFARDSVRRHAAALRASTATSAPLAASGESWRARLANRRGQLVTQMVMAGQRGELAKVEAIVTRLEKSEPLTGKEGLARRAATSFAAYAAPPADDAVALPLIWWPRPFPGNFGDWLSPLVLRHVSGQPIRFQPPTARTDEPNLVMVGSIGRFVQERSVVVGTGVSRPDAPLNPSARYVSLRGPLTARLLERRSGGGVDSFGDPGLLLPRVVPVTRGETNGRVALVRHFLHVDAPVVLAEGMDEHSVLASHPGDIAALVAKLAEYDAVVTSAMHVMIACHAYEIPCALITFDGFGKAVHGNGMKYRDYSLGAGLEEIWEPERVQLDLGAIDWMSRARVANVSHDKLDEIENAVLTGVKEYQAWAEEYLADSEEDADLDDDG